MTAFQNTLSTGPTYLDRPDKIWNVVHFLQALADPYGRQRLQDPAVAREVQGPTQGAGGLLSGRSERGEDRTVMR